MLNLTIFLPLVTALAVLAIPGARTRVVRIVAAGGSAATLLAALVLWMGYDRSAGGLQWQAVAPWIPQIGASYHVGVDGLSLPLILLTAVLMTTAQLYAFGHDRLARAHAALFLVMETGLLGLFSAQDLLLFYVFFEVALVPMYFIIGIWGHGDRGYAAMKFFLYTRGGSLAMLLSFLGLYLLADPRTFSIPQLAAADPSAGSPYAGWLLLGLVLGFGVKLPIVPLHNWLPDAHVEAPTEGSVILAGLQLKMGGYGLLRVALPLLPDAMAAFGWLLVGAGLISLVYGALAALGQENLKRLVAYTSVNHMGFVMLGTAAAALASDPAVRALAVAGATYQMVSHGLLTGGMFYMVGILQDETETLEMRRFGGLLSLVPIWSVLLCLLAFGSLGLPGLSGFVAEFQVIAATLSLSLWAAAVVVLGVAITTGLYLLVLARLLMGPPREALTGLPDLAGRRLVAVGSLVALSILLGVAPGVLMSVVGPAAAAGAP